MSVHVTRAQGKMKERFVDESPETIMILDEVFAYLSLPKFTINRFVQSGKIPGQKAGRPGRFHRDTINPCLHRGPAKKPKGFTRKA